MLGLPEGRRCRGGKVGGVISGFRFQVWVGVAEGVDRGSLVESCEVVRISKERRASRRRVGRRGGIGWGPDGGVLCHCNSGHFAALW